MSRDKTVTMMDPTKRFEKIDEIVSARTSVTAFKGYDRETGLEVTWQEVDISSLTQEQRTVFYKNVSRLQTLRCDVVISLLHSWLNEDQHTFCIITESAYSNSIFDQLNQALQEVRLSAIVRWFLPVLNGLKFLHSQNPPIVHGRVSITSIFIKPTSGHVKLSSPFIDPFSLTFEPNELKIRPTTPPEALDNNVTTASDIWCFGIAILSAITKETPYKECDTAARLIDKLTSYTPPDSIRLVENLSARDLIKKCLTTPDNRPTAEELIRHPLFSEKPEEVKPLPSPPPDGIEYIFSGKPSASGTDLPILADDETKSKK